MKQLFTLMALISYCSLSAQNTKDSIRVGNMIIVTKGGEKNTGSTNSEVYAKVEQDSAVKNQPADTIKVGNILIVNNGEKSSSTNSYTDDNNYERKKRGRRSNVSTNWLILDLGFSNYDNKTTDYSQAGTGGYLYNRAGAAPLGESDFDLNAGKSINVNIWLFMQRLNLISHHVHLKYGLGLELNNYRYKSQVSYLKENTFVTGVAPAPAIIRDSISFSKNKLAADYITVPLMLNFCTNSYNQNKGLSLSVGVSAGYLYSQRNKQVSKERGTQKTHDIGLEQFKISYVGEIGLGPIKLYGSYSPNSFYKKGLDMRPYTLGVRFSNW